MWKFVQPNHWHDKGFTLLFDFPEARWVLIRFVNGQKKPWYKITERKYRFKRWFFRKRRDKFSNIANLRSPQVILYVFPWFIAIPKKIIVPMRVKYLRTESTPLQIGEQNLSIIPMVQPIHSPAPSIKTSQIQIAITSAATAPSMELDTRKIEVANLYTFHCSDWIERGLITSQNVNISTLHKLIENPNHE